MQAKTAYFLSYDIPDDAEIPNPSPKLRKIGVRTNLSVWIIPSDKIPQALLDDLTHAGAKWDLVKFDASEAEHLALMAHEALKREIQMATQAAIANEEKARALAEASEGLTAVEAKAKYWKKVRAAIGRAKRLLKDAQTAAASFGFQTNSAEGCINFQAQVHQVQVLRAACQARAAAYASAVKALDGTAHAQPATSQEMVAAAEYLEGHGETGHAAVLQEIAQV